MKSKPPVATLHDMIHRELESAQHVITESTATTCRVEVNCGGTTFPYVASLDGSQLKLQDADESEHERTHDLSNWELVSEPAMQGRLLDTTADRIRELGTPEAIAAEWEKMIEGEHKARLSRILRVVVAAFIEPKKNLRLRAVSLAIAAELESAVGKTATAWARELGVTKAAVSKEALAWRDLLGLPESRYMKSEHARKSYEHNRKAKHWRKPVAA